MPRNKTKMVWQIVILIGRYINLELTPIPLQTFFSS